MKVLITGATGFVGQEIVRELLRLNHAIVVLTRNSKSAQKKLPFPLSFYNWEPEAGPPPAEAFAGVDAVIHLAGENLADKRWSEAQKKRIRGSRLIGTQNLVQGIDSFCKQPLKAFVSSSAIGYYGPSINAQDRLTENSPAGSGFLPEVCAAWENAAQACRKAERTVLVRTGVVLGEGGGALKKLLPIFKMGLGGPIGSGKAGFSWIHRQDLARIFVTALTDLRFKGVYNGVAPEPVSNAVFTKALGRALHRPALFPVPPFVLKAAFGEMSQIVLMSQFVIPKNLITLGFDFRYPDIQSALDAVCHNIQTHGRKKKEVCNHFEFLQWVPRPLAEVFDFFSDAHNLEVITPPSLRFQVLKQSTPQIQTGTQIDYKLKIHGIPARWTSLIEDWTPPHRFADVQTRGPYAVWDHRHEFFAYQNGSIIRDSVHYKLPLGWLGKIFGGFLVKRDVRQIFTYRQKIIREKFG